MAFDDPDMERLLRAYQMDQAIGKGVDYLMTRGDREMQREDMRLGILDKKKRLGLPTSSEDYDQLTNSSPNLMNLLMQKGIARGMEKIPHSLPDVPKEQPFFKVATAIEDLLPSLGKSKKFGVPDAARFQWLKRVASL